MKDFPCDLAEGLEIRNRASLFWFSVTMSDTLTKPVFLMQISPHEKTKGYIYQHNV